MPTAYTRTRVRRKPVPRETRVPTAMPALDRIRLERWVAAGRGVPACRAPAAGPGLAGPGAWAGRVGVKVGCGRGGWPGRGRRVAGWSWVTRRRSRWSWGPGASRAGRGAASGAAGSAGPATLSASGSVVSAGLGPPPGIGPSIGGSGSGAACRPRRGDSASPEPGSSGHLGSSGHGSSGHGGSWRRASGPGSGVVDPASCIGQVIRCLRRVSRVAGASHDATRWVRLFVDEMRVVAQPPPDGAVQRGEHEDADRGADEEQDRPAVPGGQDGERLLGERERAFRSRW